MSRISRLNLEARIMTPMESTNKVPKSDKAKLSHPLLAQRLRQLHFAPLQRR